MGSNPATPLCWSLPLWPAQDQAAWHLSLTPYNPLDFEIGKIDLDAPAGEFEGVRYGTTLREASVEKIRKGYGRWLSFLASRGWLDPSEPPLQRVTKGRVRAYVRHLLKSGNRPSTVSGRICELVMAMKMLAPGADVGWIDKPDGVCIDSILPKSAKQVRVPPPEELVAWGYELIKLSDQERRPRVRLRLHRDGLLILFLATRGRRRRSVAALRVGREFFKVGDHYRVELLPEQVKNKMADRFDLPVELTAHVDTYLNEIRPALLSGQTHDFLWIGRSGRPLTEAAISERILNLSCKRFGYGFGPHAFRHSITTMLAYHAPRNHGLAAATLNITIDVNCAHYNHAQQAHALNRHNDVIEGKLRDALLSRSIRYNETDDDPQQAGVRRSLNRPARAT